MKGGKGVILRDSMFFEKGQNIFQNGFHFFAAVQICIQIEHFSSDVYAVPGNNESIQTKTTLQLSKM